MLNYNDIWINNYVHIPSLFSYIPFHSLGSTRSQQVGSHYYGRPSHIDGHRVEAICIYLGIERIYDILSILSVLYKDIVSALVLYRDHSLLHDSPSYIGGHILVVFHIINYILLL